ncbi:hypothetical protein MMC28_000809 [Mycoblastus sanguinarius]|nr:hypothetical protein [Mycoblastus sanguinarius]
MASQYQYPPLKQVESEIRILRIHPSPTLISPLICSLTSASLTQTPQYIALSYTWGPLVRNQSITIDDHPFTITANLAMALLRLRKAGWQMIWVDAICINQDDVDERSHQVLLMKRIYTQALQVYIYLGEDKVLGTSPLTDFMNVVFLPHKEVKGQPKLEPYNRTMRAAWLDLFSRPWFSRVWVIQEATACSNTVIVCGNMALPLKAIIDGPLYLIAKLDYFHLDPSNSPTATLQTLGEGIQGIRLMKQVEPLRTQSTPTSFLTLLETCRSCHSTDPRDKIYALLGLIPDAHEAPQPDYSQSVENVYHQFALFLLAKCHSTELLHSAGRHRASLTLPSWVPDWSCNSGILQHWTTVVHEWGDNQLRASGSSPPDHRLSDDKNNLLITGSTIDSIASLGPPMKTRHWTNPQTFLAWDEASRSLLEKSNIQHTPFSNAWWEMYARTLIMNCIPTDRTKITDPVKDYGTMIERLHKGETSATRSGTSAPHYSSLTPFTMEQDADLAAVQYSKYVQQFLYRRRLCVTHSGFVGLVPDTVVEHDKIIIFLGGDTPFILREEKDAHALIGDAYIHSLMHGEALEMDEFLPQEIVLH